MQEGIPRNQVGTPPRCGEEQFPDSTDARVLAAEKVAIASSLTSQFDSLPDLIPKGLKVNSLINVRSPARVGDSSQDEDGLSEAGSLCLIEGAQSVPLPLGSFLLPATPRTPRSEAGMSSSRFSESDADTPMDSFALNQAQEVSKLRRKLLDNLKGRQRQCLRTLTPLRDLDVESAGTGMRRATTESSIVLYEREAGHASYQASRANCKARTVSASFAQLNEQLWTAMHERDEALKEVKQLRAEKDQIQEEIEYSGNTSSETMRPLRRFFFILAMLLMMLASQLPVRQKRFKGTADDKGFKQYLRQKQR